jgi:hypothetical protein
LSLSYRGSRHEVVDGTTIWSLARGRICTYMGPLLLYLDAVTVPVPDLDEGMAFYCAVLGHDLLCAGFSSDASLARLARDSRC